MGDALSDLVPFVQFKKCGKHPWRSVNFSKVAGFSITCIYYTDIYLESCQTSVMNNFCENI